MTTKDYIYIGMIVLTALAFYCNGFYAGVYRCKKMYDSLLEDSEQERGETGTVSSNEKSTSTSDKPFVFTASERDNNALHPNRVVGGDFGKN